MSMLDLLVPAFFLGQCSLFLQGIQQDILCLYNVLVWIKIFSILVLRTTCRLSFGVFPLYTLG